MSSCFVQVRPTVRQTKYIRRYLHALPSRLPAAVMANTVVYVLLLIPFPEYKEVKESEVKNTMEPFTVTEYSAH